MSQKELVFLPCNLCYFHSISAKVFVYIFITLQLYLNITYINENYYIYLVVIEELSN